MEQGYDEAYYSQYDIGSQFVSYLESPELRKFHAFVASELNAALHPRTVLDAGCAMGILVSEFRKLGVAAYGIDYSQYAVTHADPLARDYCVQGSLAEAFPEKLPTHFDLVTCMEVLEHMSPEEGHAAVANMCKVTDTIVFCSTPDDFADPTHINVQQRDYWATLFAENGFFDDLNFRPLFVTSYAVCYRKRKSWLPQISDYERYISQTDEKLTDFRDVHYKALEKEHEKAVSEWTRTADNLRELQKSFAAVDADREQKTGQLIAALHSETQIRERLEAEKTLRIAAESAATKADEQINALREQFGAELAMSKEETRTAQESLSALRRDCATLENNYNVAKESVASLQQCYNVAQESVAALQQERIALEQSYSEALHGANGRADAAERRVAALLSSTSWKVTAPMRYTMVRLKRTIGKTARTTYRVLKKLKNAKRMDAPNHGKQASWLPKVKQIADSGKAETMPENGRRLLIYSLFDKDGIVDGYVLYLLQELKPWTQRQIVVSNGALNDKGLLALKALGCEVIIRENRGFDAWGIRTGIMHVGFDGLAQYDEVLFCNNTLFGPVCSLAPMFEMMGARRVDLWGVASHAGMPDMDPFGCNPYGYIPEHIQSFFFAVRGRLLRSGAFRRFWKELPDLTDYNAAVGLYETAMTRYFSDAGYVWDCYMDADAYYGMTDNPLIAMPMEAIRDWKCPFFKRRAFFQDYDYLTTYTGQQSASCLLQYLQEQTDYPLDLVWENLIRTCHMSDLVRNMHLSEIFDRDNAFAVPKRVDLRSALFMHIYDPSMATELARYAASMPTSADIYISTTSEEKKAEILAAFAQNTHRVEVRVLPNRGRDVSALLTSFRDVVMNYDVACVTHDKKTAYLKPQTVGEGFAYMGYENILASPLFVEQVLQAFANKSRLGFLYAPDPNHADFATHIGLEWGPNYVCTEKLARELGLHVPMDEQHPPMAPFGSSFWFRTKAMKPLFDKEWTYDDFPAEPFNETDGSILHAIERIYPYVAQYAGYYSAMLMTADYAAVDVGNLYYYAQRYAHTCFESGIANRFITVRDLCNMRWDAATPAKVEENLLLPEQRRGLWLRIRNKLASWCYI